MNFNIDPILLTQLATVFPSIAPSGANAMADFLKRLSFSNVTDWRINTVRPFMQTRNDAAIVIAASPALCVQPCFFQIMSHEILSPNVPAQKTPKVTAHFQRFMLLRTTEPLAALQSLIAAFDEVCLGVPIFGLMMNSLYQVEFSPPSASAEPAQPAWQRELTWVQKAQAAGQGLRREDEHAAVFYGNPSNSGWSGAAYGRMSTPESFAASPVGQLFHSRAEFERPDYLAAPSAAASMPDVFQTAHSRAGAFASNPSAAWDFPAPPRWASQKPSDVWSTPPADNTKAAQPQAYRTQGAPEGDDRITQLARLDRLEQTNASLQAQLRWQAVEIASLRLKIAPTLEPKQPAPPARAAGVSKAPAVAKPKRVFKAKVDKQVDPS